MASLMNLAKNGIMAMIAADSDLSGSVQGCFFIKQPPHPAKPYIRVEWLGGGRSHAFKSACRASSGEFMVFFHVFSDGGDTPGASTEAETIASYIHAVFDGGELSISGYKTITLVRDTEDDLALEDDTKLWHLIARYRGRANPSAS